MGSQHNDSGKSMTAAKLLGIQKEERAKATPSQQATTRLATRQPPSDTESKEELSALPKDDACMVEVEDDKSDERPPHKEQATARNEAKLAMATDRSQSLPTEELRAEKGAQHNGATRRSRIVAAGKTNAVLQKKIREVKSTGRPKPASAGKTNAVHERNVTVPKERTTALEEHTKGNAVHEDKIQELTEQKTVLKGQLAQAEEESQRLDKELLTQEETCKALLQKNNQIKDSLSLCKDDLKAEKLKNSNLTFQVKDLAKRCEQTEQANIELQFKHDPCQTEKAELRAQIYKECERGKAYWKERDELHKMFLRVRDTNNKLTGERDHYEKRLEEVETALATLRISETKLREAARVWKNKYTKADQDLEETIKQASSLAEQNSLLRHQNSVVDDSALKASLTSLNYNIRDWCDQVVQAKPSGTWAYLSKFPLHADGTGFITELGDNELNALIACIWEWLLKMVFCREELESGLGSHPDLWTDDQTRSCLNQLERILAVKDYAIAARWRYRTVQQLSDVGLAEGDERTEQAADAILEWVAESFHLIEQTDILQRLRNELKDQILKEAIAFALDLRRQDNIISIGVARGLGQALRCVPLLNDLECSSPERDLVKICIKPQLKRCIPGSGSRMASEYVIADAVYSSVVASRPRPEGMQTMRSHEQAH